MYRNSSPDRAFPVIMIQLEVDQGGNAVVVLQNAPATSAEPVRGRCRSRQSVAFVHEAADHRFVVAQNGPELTQPRSLLRFRSYHHRVTALIDFPVGS